LNNGETRHISSNMIFINSGARPAPLAIDGAENVPVLNSTTVMELDIVPEHLLIIGGGYVCLEFGQMFRRFGSHVTIIQRANHLLSREDEDVSEEIEKIFREDGIEILLESTPEYVKQLADGKIQITAHTPQGEKQITGTHLLSATGRIPNTDKLNLQAAGIHTDRKGFIEVNDRLETNIPGIYALGDVKGGPAFTHISYDDYRIIRANLLEGEQTDINHRLVPDTVFIDPQLGRVGLSEKDARAQKRNIQVAKMPMSYVARALEVDESRGFMKVVVDAESKQILGCAILGIEGGEIMAMIEIAMMGKLPYTVLRDAIFAHPTLAESLNNLFMTLS
jgi:pyruvate/2-oxoglutarate dehydrogenase complex dihydrolipoamide dehydrogenase (E3) component